MENINFNQKGVSLLFTVFILSFILAIATGTSALLIRQIKVMKEIGFSVTAFYAADHGIEEALAMPTPTDIVNGVLMIDELQAGYNVTVEAGGTGSCNSSNYCITSVGSYKTSRRAIKVTY